MDKSKLLALADAVEKLTGPDRMTDCLIENELGLARFVEDRPAPFGGGWLDKRVDPKPITASLDAAMTLVPEGWSWTMGIAVGFQAAADLWVGGQVPGIRCLSATPALALCAAALRAQAEALA